MNSSAATSLQRGGNRTSIMALQAAAIAVLMLTGERAMSLEQPEYTVLYEEDGVEYRRYRSYLVSETVIEDGRNYQSSGNEGFRRLFRYITGANRSQAKIAMTAPVAQTPTSEKIAMTVPVQQGAAANGWSVAFMLPAQYTLETAPVPTDPRVRVREVPGRLVAALRYSGRWTESNYAKRRAELAAALDDAGVRPVGAMQSALYNAPYVPPFMRRNEVWVEIEALPAAAGITTAALSESR